MNTLLTFFAWMQATLVDLAGRKPRNRVMARGVTFIEYALLAAIAVGIGYVFRAQLRGAFNNLLQAIHNALSSSSAS